MTIDADDPRPPYRQAADAIRQDIHGGRLKAGQRLPSIRSLADTFGISTSTVQNTLSLLRSEGAIITTARGSFVSDPNKAIGTVTAGESSESLAAVLRQLEHVNSQLSELRGRVERLEADRPGRAVESQ